MSDRKNLWKSGRSRAIMKKREWLLKMCGVYRQEIRFLSRVYMPWNDQRHAMGNSHFAG